MTTKKEPQIMHKTQHIQVVSVWAFTMCSGLCGHPLDGSHLGQLCWRTEVCMQFLES